MEIDFIDDKTVNIRAFLGWSPRRPPLHLKEIVHKEHFIEEFRKQHPSYKVESALGPDSICNFRSEEDSKGEWTLTVSETKKKATSKMKTFTKKVPLKHKTTKSGF